jgi:hypothetical protein
MLGAVANDNLSSTTIHPRDADRRHAWSASSHRVHVDDPEELALTSRASRLIEASPCYAGEVTR